MTDNNIIAEEVIEEVKASILLHKAKMQVSSLWTTSNRHINILYKDIYYGCFCSSKNKSSKVSLYIKKALGKDKICWQYNDAPERTKEEVLSLINKAIIEAEKNSD